MGHLEKSTSEGENPTQAMSDAEAQEAFQYRKIATEEHYRIYENCGRCWLFAYLVPLVVIVGGYVVWLCGSGWIHQHLSENDKAYGVCLLVTGSVAASAFGLASLFRAEFHADRAFQPLVCGCLTLLFLFVWWKTM
jgi:hypothetical protein